MSFFCVITERLERSTGSLEGCCSIQLSYVTPGEVGLHFIKNSITDILENFGLFGALFGIFSFGNLANSSLFTALSEEKPIRK